MHSRSLLCPLLLCLSGPAVAVQDSPPRSRFLWADADGDGRRDAFVLRADGTGRFLAGQEQGRFADRTIAVGLGELGALREVAWGDAQGDGRLELAVVQEDGRARLFVPDEGGVYWDATVSAGLPDRDDVHAVEWLDYDQDGAADLLWHTPHEELLLRSDRRGGFESVELGLAPLAAPVDADRAGEPAPQPERDRETRLANAEPERTTHTVDGVRPGPVSPSRRKLGSDSTLLGPTHLEPTRPVPSGRAPAGDAFADDRGPTEALIPCFDNIRDMANSNCIGASSLPGLGLLYPLGIELFIDAANGYVGLGTLTPESPLHVEGGAQLGTGHTIGAALSSILAGSENTIATDHSAIASGQRNVVNELPGGDASHNFIAGGWENTIETDLTTSVGGVQGQGSAIGGGALNTIQSPRSVIGGGTDNSISPLGSNSVIAGGERNEVRAVTAVVSGGKTNHAAGDFSAISGGAFNETSGAFSAIGGGLEGVASGDFAFVPGGQDNIAGGRHSFAAGVAAEALHDGSFVWSSSFDTIATSGVEQFLIDASGGVGIGTNTPGATLDVEGEVKFGTANGAPGPSSSILAGSENTLDVDHSAVASGQRNVVNELPGGDASHNFIAGGWDNTIETDFSTGIGGIVGQGSAIGGGAFNTIHRGHFSVIAGGQSNVVSSTSSAIGGGDSNTASGTGSTIGGGLEGEASGDLSCVPGGRFNIAGGTLSFAAGLKAEALHDGSFVWSSSLDPFATSGVHQFLIDAAGGVGIGTNSPNSSLSVHEPDESASKTDFTQSLSRSGINVTTEYTSGTYAPGVFWSTDNNNATKPKAGIFMHQASNGSRLHFGTSNAYATGITNDALIIDAAGKLGVGTGDGSIDAILHVQANSTRSAKFDRFGTDGELVAWARDDSIVGNVTVSGGTVSYNAFTGSHYAWSEAAPEVGALMVLTGDNRSLAGAEASEIVYGVAPCARANDPACLGAYVSTTPIGEGDAATSVRLVAAVGNGELWVLDTGSDIAPGDLLIASGVSGCAMLDDPEQFATGHIVARAAEAVQWGSVEGGPQSTRRARISVLFEPFTRGGESNGRYEARIRALQDQVDELRALIAGAE